MEQINIAELLKDCPRGMELYSPLCGECYFDRLNFGTIICKKQNTQEITFTSGGYYMLPVFDDCECQLFPSKDQRDWSKFEPPCKFKDGDILFVKSIYDWILIYKESENNEDLYKYVSIPHNCFYKFITYDNYPICRKKEISEIRLATEEEKQKLFDEIKINGYKWNEETKTLEKLVKPWTIQDANDGDVLAFNDETIVIFKDLYNKTSFHSYCHIEDGIFTISKEDTPDWWEGKGFYLATKEQCNLLFQKIKEAGYIWNEETKTLDKLVVKSKFKVGDCVVHHKYGKGDITQILWLADEIVYEIYFCDTHFERFTIYCKAYELCNYELVQVEPKFKAGDRIVKKGGVSGPVSITGVGDEYYYSNTESSVGVLPIAEQDNWELVPAKFDVTTLKTFDKVLVRHNKDNKWRGSFFSHMDEDLHYHCYKYVTIGGKSYPMCIPHEGNEYLLGKTDDCDEYFKTWE